MNTNDLILTTKFFCFSQTVYIIFDGQITTPNIVLPLLLVHINKSEINVLYLIYAPTFIISQKQKFTSTKKTVRIQALLY